MNEHQDQWPYQLGDRVVITDKDPDHDIPVGSVGSVIRCGLGAHEWIIWVDFDNHHTQHAFGFGIYERCLTNHVDKIPVEQKEPQYGTF